jgi:DDE family transposase
MIERVEERFDLKPGRLIGDTAYGAAPMLAWLVEEKAIEPHVPVCDKTERNDGTLSSNDFQWHEQANEYRCPQGHALRSNWRDYKNVRTHITKADTIIYRSKKSDCAACTMKQQCCPNTAVRKIARSIHEASRNVARRIATTLAYQRSRRERKKVEVLFAHLKRILKLDRLRLRGFTLAAAVQNLRRMARLIAQGPPPHGIGAPA